MPSVPAIAVLLSRATGAGVTLWVALAAVGIVFVTGVLAFAVKGAARGAGGPLLPSPDVVRDPRVLLLVAGVFALALATMLHMPAPGWLLLVIAAGLVLAGALVPRAAPSTAQPGNAPAPAVGSAASAGAGGAPPAGTRAGPGQGPGSGPHKPAGPGRPAGPAPGSAGTMVAPTGSAGSAASAEQGG